MSYIWSADAAVPSGSRTMRKLGPGAMPQRGLVLCNGVVLTVPLVNSWRQGRTYFLFLATGLPPTGPKISQQQCRSRVNR